MRISVISFFIFIGFTSCLSNAEINTQTKQKINGVSFAASKILIDSIDLNSVKNVGANWVSLMPYGFIREGETELSYNSDWQWVGETSIGTIKDIEVCKQAGFKIMLKPHVWISHGAYTGDFELGSEADWKEFENSYKKYILEFANIAENLQVEMFCIGTEWRKFIKERPQFWTSLIVEIRKVYSGKLTYASNWDEYKETPFWKQLDYIGVNAYFPLTEAINPSEEELQLAWITIISRLEEISDTYNKQLIYTEYGYRSTEGTTIKPWESYSKLPISMEEQKVALHILYKNNWDQPWLAGGFLWKWFNKHLDRGGENHSGYTPQNKPAELVIKKYYDLGK